MVQILNMLLTRGLEM